MNTIDVETIVKKIEQLEAERAKFVEQANVQVERLTGAILGLKELLNNLPVPDPQNGGENETDS